MHLTMVITKDSLRIWCYKTEITVRLACGRVLEECLSLNNREYVVNKGYLKKLVGTAEKLNKNPEQQRMSLSIMESLFKHSTATTYRWSYFLSLVPGTWYLVPSLKVPRITVIGTLSATNLVWQLLVVITFIPTNGTIESHRRYPKALPHIGHFGRIYKQ